MARILIVSPDESQASLWSEAIHRAGMPTHRVADRDAALRQLAEETPDLILLDLAVNEGQGAAVCAAIRELDGGDLVPILLIGTGQEGVRNFGEALAEGADYYFEKPVEHGLLLDKIRSHVGVDREGSTMVGPPPVSSDAIRTLLDEPAVLEEPGDDEGMDFGEAVLSDRVEQMLDLGQSFADGLLPPAEPDGDTPPAEQIEPSGDPGLSANQLFGDISEETTEPSGGLLPPRAKEQEPEEAWREEEATEKPEQEEPAGEGDGFLQAPAEQKEKPARELRSLEDKLMASVEQSDSPKAEKELALMEREMELLKQVSTGEEQKKTDDPEISVQSVEFARTQAEPLGDDQQLLVARRQAESEARSNAREKARTMGEQEGLKEALTDAQEQAQEEALLEAAELAQRQARAAANEEAGRKVAQELAEQRLEEEKTRKEQAKRKEDQEAKRKEEEEAKRKEDQEAKRKEEEEAKRKEEEEAKRKEDQEAKRK
ncbi:MAG: response regulator, partial [Deltaproteobacteria bacterium]|nr:response regulator [Deltaproteobacteria bacterium]